MSILYYHLVSIYIYICICVYVYYADTVYYHNISIVLYYLLIPVLAALVVASRAFKDQQTRQDSQKRTHTIPASQPRTTKGESV